MTTDLIQKLNTTEYGQQHLVENFDHWTQVQKDGFIADITSCEKNYPGGLLNYIQRSRKFLADSANDVNPFEGYEPAVPLTSKFEPGTAHFEELETMGLDAMKGMTFVLVAGGLGERLGYDGIKVALPTECNTSTTYLQLYCEYILAFQDVACKRSGTSIVCPLAIMTSEDTYSKTVELLKQNDNFGLDSNQVTIMKQEKVPALLDSSARIAQNIETKRLELKPHGHGDVHQLLISHGLPEKWLAEGKTHMLFFQDTNALVFRVLPATLGFSVQHNLAMNTICIARKAGEAVGGICKLVNKETQHEMTINVEYNQLGPLLVSVGGDGDVADPTTGNSLYPGNTNALLFSLPRYQSVMEETGGNIPEFVNPKYADDTKTTFKSPTRLECMMQEYPRLLTKDDPVGCVEAPRYLCFSTVKNHYTDAIKKIETGGVPECAFSGEADLYASNLTLLRLAAEAKNCKIELEEAQEETWLGVRYPLGPRVVLKPSFGVCLTEIMDKIVEGSILKISRDSTLILEGDVVLNGLTLDGSLYVSSNDSSRSINNVERISEKCVMKGTTDADSLPYRIRGYKIECPSGMKM